MVMAPHLWHSATNSATPRPAFASREKPPCRFCSFDSFASIQQDYARNAARGEPKAPHPELARGRPDLTPDTRKTHSHARFT